ncbi:MAG: ATP-dependent DNA helicase [Cellulomonas sp.]|nr:ATP-dependent DNA helicase [Cellulomonas sp.]
MPDDHEEAAGIDRLLDRAVAALGGTRREGQLTMAREVARAVETGEHLLVQAGTGTGKSLAYLVPAVAHAVRTDERVVVSTATLALQRQVVGRDLPLVADALAGDLPRRPTVALLKGWQHYLCVHKAAGGYPAEETLFDSEEVAPDPAGLGAQVLRLREWAAGTGTGDRDELVPGVSERAWRQVSVTSLECLGRRCPMLTECFAEAAREQSRRADVVVTNHAMLAVAATGASQVLPEHQVLVVDEAHELADRVTAQATLELSIATIEQAGRSARRNGGVPTTDLDSAGQQLATVLVGTPEGRFAGALPAPLAEAVGAVRDAARALVSALRPSSPGSGGDPVAEGGRSVAAAAMLALFEVAQTMAGDAEELAQTVLWCARDQDPRGVPQTRLHAAPLAVNGLIRSRLLDGRSATLTSATLSLGGSFDPAARSVGLMPAGGADEGATWQALDVGSPFDYRRQGICYVAKHLPAPGREPATQAQLDEIEALVRAAGGRTLGLFSSRRAATAAAAAMRERLDVPVLVQGDDQLGTLVDRFTADPATCLFGTLSLWQGVDVPGATCRLVVIDRIPFPRPDDPVSSARSEAVVRAGGNGFMAVAASHAALLLAQGSGRLIRTTADRGVVAVLDPRLVTSRYGEYLLRSMPPFWRTTDRQVALDALSRLAVADEPDVRPVDGPGEPG